MLTLKKNICAVVIWYNPSYREVENISTYSEYVDKVIVVDNSDYNNLMYLKDISNIEYIPNNSNLGIAKALNIGCEKAIYDGYDWVLTMDQDSNFNYKEIENYMISFEKRANVDINISIFAPKTTEIESYGYVNKVITSGNIVNLQAYKDVNGFDDELFIDEVDHDFCFRLINKGYKIYKFKDILMNHKLGDIKDIKILFKNFKTSNHNYIRRYYMTRNRFIIRKRHSNYTPGYIKSNIIEAIKIILAEEDKFRKLKYMFKGYIDYKKGIRGKLKV